MQKYVAEAKSDMSGLYVIARRNEVKDVYEPIKGDYLTLEEAECEAARLNREYLQDLKDKENSTADNSMSR